MKILIVGSNNKWAIERYYVKYLQACGAEVVIYPAADIVFDYHSKNLLNKVLFKTKLKTGYKEVNRGLMEMAKATRPDIIWVFKGMEIYPETLDSLKKSHFRLANYNPDHPFIIISSGSGNRNVSDSVGLYDLHFCYHNNLLQEIREKFGIATVFLPFAYEATDVVYTDPAEIREINKICFQANPDEYRAHVIQLLSKNGFEVDVFGYQWDKYGIRGLKNVNVYGLTSRKDFWRMNQEYRLQLNLFRKYNTGSHNMRTFEIPAVGGIQLAPYSEEQAGFFTPDEEIFLFRNEQELVEKAEAVLKMDEYKIQAIRNKARKRSLDSDYTFQNRARTVYEAFDKMIKEK